MDHFLKCFTVFLSVYVLNFYASAELTNFLWTDDEVSGVYKNEDGSLGIKFVSRQGYLQVSTLNKITLVDFSSFYEVNKRMARSVYMLDGEYLQHKYTADSHLDKAVGNTQSFNDTLNRLLYDTEEITLLEGASYAVGAQGVTGKNTPAALPFYMFALKMTTLLNNSVLNSTTKELHERSIASITLSAIKYIKKVPWGRVIPAVGKVFDLLKKWITNSKKCKKFEKYSDCKGLCGYKCECWVFLCEDCCYHKGCYEHDQCCERHGYSDPRCITGFIKLECDKSYDC